MRAKFNNHVLTVQILANQRCVQIACIERITLMLSTFTKFTCRKNGREDKINLVDDTGKQILMCSDDLFLYLNNNHTLYDNEHFAASNLVLFYPSYNQQVENYITLKRKINLYQNRLRYLGSVQIIQIRHIGQTRQAKQTRQTEEIRR